MTLVEFISPLRKGTHRDRILAILYFSQRYEKVNAIIIEQIKERLKRSRAPNWRKANISDVLIKSGHLVDTPGIINSKRLWNLTPTGIDYVQKLLNLPSPEPEIEHDVGSLIVITKTISNKLVKDYIDEAIKCLQVGALRACVVFLWSGAIRFVQNRLLTYSESQRNAAIIKHDPRARNVRSIDHFSYIKDKVTILSAFELGVFDKNQKDTLEEALNLRNRCGHPGKYKPGIKKVSSYIEDLLSILFR